MDALCAHRQRLLPSQDVRCSPRHATPPYLHRLGKGPRPHLAVDSRDVKRRHLFDVPLIKQLVAKLCQGDVEAALITASSIRMTSLRLRTTVADCSLDGIAVTKPIDGGGLKNAHDATFRTLIQRPDDDVDVVAEPNSPVRGGPSSKTMRTAGSCSSGEYMLDRDMAPSPLGIAFRQTRYGSGSLDQRRH